MMPKVFLDTNILIYAMDQHDPKKLSRSREIITMASGKEYPGVISTQVLQEFYVASTKKLGLDPVNTKQIMKSFQRLEVVTVMPELIFEAIDCSITNRLSFWDSLIIITAESANCAILYTEDMSHGQIVRGVQIENPFIQNF